MLPSRLANRLLAPIDGASVAFFRISFGLMMFLGTIRFLSKGWVEELYIAPTFYFSYYGFSWVKPLPGAAMYLPFFILAVLSLLIAAGWLYRWAMPLFFLVFTYVELLDKANYLNHYYFISVLSFLMSFLPLNKTLSVDAMRKGDEPVPNWTLDALRLQVGIVYFFAGLAKLKGDWLVEALPLRLWLSANSDFPLIGFLLAQPWVGHAASLMGAVFDLTIPFWLLWRRSRPFAYVAVVIFHVFTWKLFRIGMFPWIMIVSALVFFEPGWPRRFLKGLKPFPVAAVSLKRISTAATLILIVFFTLQLLLPLRHWIYPGHVLWTEEGYRFSWNVMLMEKNGTVEYEVKEASTGKKWVVLPSDYLKPYQVKQMSTQPDMILALAHHIARDFKEKGHGDVTVQAQAWASLNGRLPKRLIDPTVDLSRIPDSLLHQNWILAY